MLKAISVVTKVRKLLLAIQSDDQDACIIVPSNLNPLAMFAELGPWYMWLLQLGVVIID